jgi:uncharacterized RDD family membrane protein YckC
MSERPDRRRPPFPARVLGTGARGVGRVGEAIGLDRAAEAAAEEAIVRALESEAVERALGRVLEGPALERAVAKALQSPAVEESWDRLLASDEAQRLVQRIAEAPEIRAAIAAQSAGLLEEIARQVQRVARRLDDGLERFVRRVLFRRKRAEATDCAGAVSRAVGFAVDVTVINVGFFAVSAAIALAAAIFLPSSDGVEVSAIAVGTTVWLIAGALYMLVFWGLTGQTPGMRIAGIAVLADRPGGIGVRRSIRRLLGMALSVLTLGLGFLGVLFGERRRGLPDVFAGTEVRYTRTPD